FHPLERGAGEVWRWMGADARWLLQAREPATATLELELSAYREPRKVAISLDGRSVAVIEAGLDRSWHRVGPLTLTPGQHTVKFAALDAPSPVSAADLRLLSIRLHDWRWR